MRNKLGILALVVGALAGVLSGAVQAQAYPSKPIKIVVPFAPGGAFDAMGRFVAQWLQDGLQQSAYVENKTGAGGIVGLESVATSPPDGYTLGIVPSSMPTFPVMVKDYKANLTE